MLQRLGTWLLRHTFSVRIPPGVSSDRVGVMGSERLLAPGVASVLAVIRAFQVTMSVVVGSG